MTMRFEHDFTVPVPIEQAWSVLLDVERVAPCLPGATLGAVDGDVFTGRMKLKVGPITVTYRGEASFASVDKDAHAFSLKASGKEARGTGTASAVVSAALTGEGTRTRVTVETSFTVTGRPAQLGRGVMAEAGARLIDRFAANLATLLRESAEEVTPAALAEGTAPAELAAEPAATPFNEPATVPPGADLSLEEPVAPLFGAPTDLGEPGDVATGAPPVPARHLSAVPDAYGEPFVEEAPGRQAHPAGTARTSRTAEEEALDLLEIAGVPLLKRAAPLVAALAAMVVLGWLIRRVLTRR